MNCQRCGYQNPDSNAFCQQCGMSLKDVGPAFAAPVAPETATPVHNEENPIAGLSQNKQEPTKPSVEHVEEKSKPAMFPPIEPPTPAPTQVPVPTPAPVTQMADTSHSAPTTVLTQDKQPAYQQPMGQVKPMQNQAQPMQNQGMYNNMGQAQQNVAYQNSTYPNNQYQNNGYANAFAPVSNAITDKFKQIAKSPLVLVAAIACTLAWVLTVGQSIFSGSVVMLMENIMFSVLGSSDLDFILTMLNTSNVSRILFTIIGSWPAIVTFIALLTIYSAGKKPGAPKTGGLTAIKVVAIFKLIFNVCIPFLFVEISILICAIASSSMAYMFDMDSDAFVVAALIAMLVTAIYFVFRIIFQAKVISTVGSMSKTAKTGTVVGKGSVFVAVICLIAGIFNVISFLSCIGGTFALKSLLSGALYYYVPMSMLPSISIYMIVFAIYYLAVAISNICFSQIIFKYNKEMNA